jgi:signal transduction histidine kinase
MTETPDPMSKLRHDIANPLGAIMAEAQLQLLSESRLDPEVAQAFREIERLCRVIRDKLRPPGGLG